MDVMDEKQTTVKYEKPDSITLTKSVSGKHAYSIKLSANLSAENYEKVIKRLDDLVSDLNKRFPK